MPIKRKTNGKIIKRDDRGRIAKGSGPLNPVGAPKRGNSWKEIVKEIGDMTPQEAADHCWEIAKKIKSIGNAVTLKEAVIMRVFTSLLFEPDARLLSVIMDRDEGKVPQPIELTWREKLQDAGIDPDDAVRQVQEWLAAGGEVAEGESIA